MSFTLVFTDDYTRRAARFIKKHPEIKAQYGKTLELLESNPNHPSLRLHALRGRLQGLHAVSINLSYRITLKLMILETEVVLVDVGSHDDVY
jgi:mRNA-degrading endonuclease YafQ of YafQ-DinJ toxin-antitoxin module